MVAHHCGACASDRALAETLAGKVGVGRETVRHWIIQAHIDAWHPFRGEHR
jgi:hypothetical protein